MDARLFVFAKADCRDHGRDWHDTDGQQAALQKMVQETALAGFESSQHGNADSVPTRHQPRTGDKAGQRVDVISLHHFLRQAQSAQ